MRLLLLYFLILSLFITIAEAERGIVLNNTGHVQYKYDTPIEPMLQTEEYIVVYEDINSVLAGAKYDGIKFVNPVLPVPVKYEEIELKAEQSKIDPTQTIISGLAGAGAAIIVARRKKET